MKRLHLLAALCVALLLTGCAGGNPDDGSDTTTATTVEGIDDATNNGGGPTTGATTTTLTNGGSTTETAEATPEPTATATTIEKPTESVIRPTTGAPAGEATTRPTATRIHDGTTTAGPVGSVTTVSAIPETVGVGTATQSADSTASDVTVASSDELSAGEYYRLNTTVSAALVEFEVISVEDGEATVEVTSTPLDGNESTTTVRGNSVSVLEQVIDSEAGFGFFLLARSPTAVVEGRPLSVGEEFTVDSAAVKVGDMTPESGTFSVAVTGTDTVSGIDCTTVEISLVGQKQTACVNESLLFAPRTTLYNDEGEPTGSIFVEEYRAGND